ncbi:MAG: hypothetical protein NXI24_04970 [bacterium]|nr:hypothetical protein [bacterium]
MIQISGASRSKSRAGSAGRQLRAVLTIACLASLMGVAPLAADFEELTGSGDARAEYLAEGSQNSAADSLKRAGKEIEAEAEEIVEEAAEDLIEAVFGSDGDDSKSDDSKSAGQGSFAQFEASGALIYYHTDLKDAVAKIEEPIQRGLALIQSELESPGLPRSPQFWLVANEAQLAALLTEKFPQMKPETLKAAASARAYVKDDAFFLVYKSRIARQRLIRLIYNEFALLHLNVLAAGGPDKRVAWFHSGMAAYMAWISEAELAGTGIKDVEKKMIQYYVRNFDPAKARSLKQLEQPAAWAEAIRTDHKAVYAQAALTWMYLVRRSSLSAGPLILRSMATGESFADAFLNATDLRLGRFERDVRDSFYPELKAARKKVRQANAETVADEQAREKENQAKEPANEASPANAGDDAKETEPEPEPEPKVKAKSDSEPKVKAKSEANPEAKAKTNSEAKAKSETKAKPEGGSGGASQAKPNSDKATDSDNTGRSRRGPRA